jgi:hypothetical protein
MEEVLCNIEIHKETDRFLGKIYSEVCGVKEFNNERIDSLFRDIILDIQLAYDEFSNQPEDIQEDREDIK